MQKSKPRGWEIVCRGMDIPVDFPVRGFAETGFRFVGRHRAITSVIVNHWTGAENPPGVVYNSLSTHKNAFNAPEPLSIHFVVDWAGIVYQMADTELRGAHCRAQGLNGLSIGIEFIGRGSALDAPSRNVVRDLVEETLHGRRVKYYELTDAQTRTGVKLNRTLCNLYGLPFRVPVDADGRPHLSLLSDSQMRAFTGCVAHGHAEAKKIDCGLKLLRAIHEASLSVV